MKNKLLLLALILTFSSCGIFKTTNAPKVSSAEVEEVKEIDSTAKFIGKYDITVFGVPDVGELELIMNVTRDDGNELKTEIEEDILYVDVYVDGYGINVSFEIYVDGNTVTGYLADMFELEGTITKYVKLK